MFQFGFGELMGLSTALLWSVSCNLHASVNRVVGPVGLRGSPARFSSLARRGGILQRGEHGLAGLFTTLASAVRLSDFCDLRIFLLQRRRQDRS